MHPTICAKKVVKKFKYRKNRDRKNQEEIRLNIHACLSIDILIKGNKLFLKSQYHKIDKYQRDVIVEL